MALEADLTLRAYVGSLESKGKRVRIAKGSTFDDLVSTCAAKFGISRSDVNCVEDTEQCEIDDVDVLEKGEKIILIVREGVEARSPRGAQTSSSLQSQAAASGVDRTKEDAGLGAARSLDKAALDRKFLHCIIRVVGP